MDSGESIEMKGQNVELADGRRAVERTVRFHCHDTNKHIQGIQIDQLVLEKSKSSMKKVFRLGLLRPAFSPKSRCKVPKRIQVVC